MLLFTENPRRRLPGNSVAGSFHSRKLRQALYPFTLIFVDQLGGANPLVPPFREREQRVSQETSNRYFDELASGSISRGRALRLMGAALLGGALASLGIGGVAAADECKPPREGVQEAQSVL